MQPKSDLPGMIQFVRDTVKNIANDLESSSEQATLYVIDQITNGISKEILSGAIKNLTCKAQNQGALPSEFMTSGVIMQENIQINKAVEMVQMKHGNELTTLKIKLNSLNDEYQKLQKQYSDLKHDSDLKIQALEQQKQQLQNLQSANQQQEIQQFQRTIENMKNEYDILASKFNQITAIVSQKDQEMQQMKQSMHQINIKYDGYARKANQFITERDVKIQRLELQCQQMFNENAENKQLVENAKTSLMQQNNQIQALQFQLQQSKIESNKRELELTQKLQKVKSLLGANAQKPVSQTMELQMPNNNFVPNYQNYQPQPMFNTIHNMGNNPKLSQNQPMQNNNFMPNYQNLTPQVKEVKEDVGPRSATPTPPLGRNENLNQPYNMLYQQQVYPSQPQYHVQDQFASQINKYSKNTNTTEIIPQQVYQNQFQPKPQEFVYQVNNSSNQNLEETKVIAQHTVQQNAKSNSSNNQQQFRKL